MWTYTFTLLGKRLGVNLLGHVASMYEPFSYTSLLFIFLGISWVCNMLTLNFGDDQYWLTYLSFLSRESFLGNPASGSKWCSINGCSCYFIGHSRPFLKVIKITKLLQAVRVFSISSMAPGLPILPPYPPCLSVMANVVCCTQVCWAWLHDRDPVPQAITPQPKEHVRIWTWQQQSRVLVGRD